MPMTRKNWPFGNGGVNVKQGVRLMALPHRGGKSRPTDRAVVHRPIETVRAAMAGCTVPS
jgi:hypothetical protein